MKQKDVVIGQTYITLVSGTPTRVVVLAETHNFSKRALFVVKREDNGQRLPKPRTPAALHDPIKPELGEDWIVGK